MNGWRRVLLAVLVGLLSGLLSFALLWQRGTLAGDFTVSWLAAQALAAGNNPYETVRRLGSYPFNTPFFYPLPAALAALPLAWLPPQLAGAMFFGVSSGLLAYAVTREDGRYLPLFLSAPFLVALALAQWSPLMLAACFLPALGWLLACKPNLGIPVLISRPTWRALVSLAVFGLISLAVRPTWLLDWRTVISGPSFHIAPFLVFPAGWLLLLAAARWREPGGRLLLAMALLPQSMWFYDQLILWALPRSLAQSWLLTISSWLAYLLWWLESDGNQPVSGQTNPGKYIILFIYLPALLMTLFPNALPLTRNALAGYYQAFKSRLFS
jgi:hypothetical protein